MHETPITASQYSGALRRRWLMIVVIVALTVGAATALALASPKKYEGEADILVTPFDDRTNTFAGFDLMRDSATAVYTTGRLLTTPQLLDAANRRLDLGFDRRALLEHVRVLPLQQSNLVAIIAKSDSPEKAARIANTLADTLIEQRTAAFQRQVRAAIADVKEGIAQAGPANVTQVEALQTRLADLRAVAKVTDPTLDIFSRAVPDTRPVSPKPKLNILIGFIAGLLLAAIATLVRELLDTRLREGDEELAQLPILASIPRAPDRRVRRYLRARGSLPSDLWEAYRTLRASLGGLDVVDGVPRTILVTSAIQGEGKTMTAVNLAITLAAGGTRVVLVDGDLRRPMVASVFGAEPPPVGFASLLQGTGVPEEALLDAPGHPNLRLLLSGAERPLDLLEARRLKDVLTSVKRHAEIVIVDSPPVTEFADAHALADAVDIVLVAVRLSHSREDEFRQLRRFFSQHRLTPAGCVVTSRQRSRGAGRPAPGSDATGGEGGWRVPASIDGARDESL